MFFICQQDIGIKTVQDFVKNGGFSELFDQLIHEVDNKDRSSLYIEGQMKIEDLNNAVFKSLCEQISGEIPQLDKEKVRQLVFGVIKAQLSRKNRVTVTRLENYI